MKNIKSKKVPNCLRKYRRVRGFSQREVAVLLGFKSTSMISRWEKGHCMPSYLNVLRLAIVYRTMTDALFIDLMRLLRDDIRKKEERVLRTKEKKNVLNVH